MRNADRVQTADMSIRFFEAPRALRSCVFGFFLLETFIPDGKTVSDLILPAYGIVSLRDRPSLRVEYRTGATFDVSRMGAVGPSDQALRLEVGPVRQWSVVLLPGAWSGLIAASARDYVNRVFDFQHDPAFAVFHDLADALFPGAPDEEGELSLIERSLCDALLPICDEAEERIAAIMFALGQADIAKVSDLAASAGVSRKTLERCCEKHFGLSPKVLLQRQRFMRSVVSRMAGDKLSWTSAMDSLYHDQPHFVREFRRIMGMSPSEFASCERPLMNSVLAAGLRYWQSQDWDDLATPS